LAAAESARSTMSRLTAFMRPRSRGWIGWGVFEGTECAEDLFCPQEPVPRWVMAVWMVKGRSARDRGSGRMPYAVAWH